MTQNDDKISAPDARLLENQDVADNEGGQPDRVEVARVAELEEQLAALRNDYLRALADAQNAQTRADRRIAQNTKYAVANFVKDLVTVADNLNRALQHVPAEARTHDDLLNGLATGVEMTEKSLLTLMECNGLRRFDSLNQPFDPNRHQAVQEIEEKSVPTGTVVQVLQEGYILRDRLVRPAMVVVSRGGPKRQAPPLQEPIPPTPGEWDSCQDPAGSYVDTSA